MKSVTISNQLVKSQSTLSQNLFDKFMQFLDVAPTTVKTYKTGVTAIYDLDLGLNVPFEYKDNIDPEFKKSHEDYIKTLYAPNYLAKYISKI